MKKIYFFFFTLMLTLPTWAHRYLIEFHQPNILINTYSVWIQSEQLKLESDLGFKLKNPQPLWITQSIAADLTEQQKQLISQHSSVVSVSRLGRKAKLQAASEYTYGLEKVKMPEVHQRFPEIKGTGSKVGIIDTGLDPRHPDLKSKMISFRDFTESKNNNPRDDHGHGTHVAGTIAGGKASGEWIGLAPEAQLYIAKGFNSRGNSSDEGLLQALQWMADPDQNPDTNDFPRVISNSWNIDEGDSSQLDPANEPFCRAIDLLRSRGIAVVFAAGNDGPSASTILIPGACPSSITVGATNSRDTIASFSSRGPVRWKNLVLTKPDISAPGESVDSADPGGGYRTRSGTSMATPHVAGALALIFQMNPQIDLETAQNILLSGADDLGAPGFDNVFGTGRLNVLKALEQTPAGN